MASLYDDIEVETLPKKTITISEPANTSVVEAPPKSTTNFQEVKAEPSTTSVNKINLTFLKSQLEAKRAILQNTQRLSSAPSPNVNRTSKFSPSVATPPLQQQKSLLSLKPRKAQPLPLDNTTTGFTIIPKSIKEDKIFLFGEILVGGFILVYFMNYEYVAQIICGEQLEVFTNSEDEYNPTTPTEYASYKQKMEAQRARERAAREVAERLQKQHEEEESKRKMGAAIAPPPQLLESDVTTKAEPPAKLEPPPQFGKTSTRGLAVAANIMQKLGYRQGGGLGRTEQGISRALEVKRTGKNLGLIIADEDDDDGVSESEAKKVKTEVTVVEQQQGTSESTQPQPSITELLRHATKIVLLKNMAHPSEVDSDLENEVREEMKKYGQLNNVIVHQIPNVADEEAVRVFLEFTNLAQAIKAVVDLNGRFFAGRPIRPSFFPSDEFTQRKLDFDPKT